MIKEFFENLTFDSAGDTIDQDSYMGYQLSAPESFWNAGPENITEVVNGCGTSGIIDWLVPDHLYFLSILAA